MENLLLNLVKAETGRRKRNRKRQPPHHNKTPQLTKAQRQKPKDPNRLNLQSLQNHRNHQNLKKEKNKKDKPKVVIIREDKETQAPEPEEEEIEIILEPPPPPLPGEKEWKYVDVSIPDYLQIVLATLWENAEDVYITDLKQLFFVKRVIMNAVIPYLTYVNKHMRLFIARPDDRQSHMSKFQRIYNEMDEDMRDDDEVKAELHCRIVEFREKLWVLSDNRMREAEAERQRIIEENWTTSELYELTNNYIAQFQVELDRFVDTLQVLTDYYTASVTKQPSKEEPQLKKALVKMETCSASNITDENLAVIYAIQKILKEVDASAEHTPFHVCVESNYRSALDFVFKSSSSAHQTLDKVASILRPKAAEKEKQKSKTNNFLFRAGRRR